MAYLAESLHYKRGRFPLVSLEFFIDAILPASLRSWGPLSLLTEMSTRNIDIDIYLTAVGLAPGGSITRHIYNQTIPNLHREKNFGSAVRAPSLLSVIPWHSPNN